MYKTTVTTLILGSVLTASVFAMPLQKQLGLDKRNYATKATAEVVDLGQVYVNFSGTWEGYCGGQGNDGEDKAQLEIKQSSAQYITINEEEYAINSLKTESTSDDSKTYYDHSQFSWNPEKTRLFLSGTTVSIMHSYPTLPEEYKQMSTHLFHGTFSINNNNQLVFQAEMTNFASMRQIGSVDAYRCVFNKIK